MWKKVALVLVKRDRDGYLQTVRYDAVNAMLLNEFFKAHQKIEQTGACYHRAESRSRWSQ